VLAGAACGSDRASESVATTRPPRPTTTTRDAITSTTATASTTSSTPSTTRAFTADRHGPFAVVRVVDGDTVKVSNGATLRLIGVDTPETVDPRKPVQCFGREASLRAHSLLDGASVWLEYDASQGRIDKYGRTLAYLWLPDGRMYNETIIAEGFAHEYTYAIPYRYQDRFVAAERAARDGARGLWSPATCAGDTTQPAAAPVVPSAGVPRPGCDPSYPDACIPPSPPDLDCADVPQRGFRVAGADPHRFDADRDGFGCE
jgi:micrococcal nuclease